MSEKLSPEDVLGLAAALGFWGKLQDCKMPRDKVREDFISQDPQGASIRAAWAASAHEACSMAAILRDEAQAAVNARKAAAVEKSDGIVEDDYKGAS